MNYPQTDNFIKMRLKRIYSNIDAKLCFERINALIDQYKREINPKPHIESEKDIILISYGDHIYGENEKPLRSLKNFLDDNCQGCINSVHILPFYPYSSDDGFGQTCSRHGSGQH